jgi:hypothetical protein
MEDSAVGDKGLSERLLTEEEVHDEEDVGEFIVDPLQAGHGLRGEGQPAQYRDTPFALAFVAQLVVVLFMSIFF